MVASVESVVVQKESRVVLGSAVRERLKTGVRSGELKKGVVHGVEEK